MLTSHAINFISSMAIDEAKERFWECKETKKGRRGRRAFLRYENPDGIKMSGDC